MPFNNQGSWEYEDDGVANRIAAITSGNSSYMRQARTSGIQAANRRGLGNSSMAIGAAQGAAIDRAAPIASQEASQIAQRNLAQMTHLNDFDRDAARYAAAEREMLARAITDLTGQRYGAYATVAQNPDIPADARNSIYSSINDQQTQALQYLERLYGVSLANGPQPAGATGSPAPTAPPTSGNLNGLYAWLAANQGLAPPQGVA